MGGYIVNFAIYTMAMMGLIFFALMIYQKVSQSGNFGIKKSSFLEVEETMTMGARKTLYVVRAGQERFLLASDMEKTSFIAKLTDSTKITNKSENTKPYCLDELYGIEEEDMQPVLKPVKNPGISVDEIPSIVQFPQQQKVTKNNKVIKNMLQKINR